MLQPVNIAYAELQSNYRLRGEPVKLMARIIPVLEADGTDRWEGEGGACAPEPYEVEDLWRYRSAIRRSRARGQRAAKWHIPKNSITIVPLTKGPRDAFDVLTDLGMEVVK